MTTLDGNGKGKHNRWLGVQSAARPLVLRGSDTVVDKQVKGLEGPIWRSTHRPVSRDGLLDKSSSTDGCQRIQVVVVVVVAVVAVVCLVSLAICLPSRYWSASYVLASGSLQFVNLWSPLPFNSLS